MMPRSGRCRESLKAHALGQILDFVPNHMGVGGADNPLWLDVLEWGADAAHAGWFDIDWDPERRYLHNKILVPLLGDQYGIELERGALRLQFDATEGSFAVWAYDTHKLPISPPHYARILNDGQLQLEQLADAFDWLPNWRQQMPQRAAEFKAQLATPGGRAPRGARGAAAHAEPVRGPPRRQRQLARARCADTAAALAHRAFSRGRGRHQLPPLLQHQRTGGPAHGGRRKCSSMCTIACCGW